MPSPLSDETIQVDPAVSRVGPRLALILILVVSSVLRVILVFNGGQFFWLDESFRFHPCLQIVDAVQYPNHTWTEVADVMARQHLHTGFVLIGVPVTAVAQRLMRAWGLPSVQMAAALILCFASVACIALVYAIARRLQASRWEAVVAASLMAATNCMFYYSRHVLPYDCALALSLLTLWWGLHPRASVRRSFVFGVLGGTAYLVYFGYLTTVLAITAVCFLRDLRSRNVIGRGIAVAAGFALLPLTMHGYTLIHSGGAVPFLHDVLALMKLADQGGYAEGWTVPWAYLWYSEYGLLLVWLTGAVAVLALAAQGGSASRTRGLLWLALAGLIYAQLAVGSTVLHQAVVLGRFARQLVPFFCLATAAAAADLWSRDRGLRAALVVAAAALVVQTAFNFSGPLRQWFIPEVEHEVRTSYAGASLTRDVSVVGPEWDAPVDRSARFVLMNTITFPYPAKAVAPPTAGRVVLRHAHPLEFIPNQYEVFDAPGRAVLQSADLSMRLIDTSEP